MITNQAHNKEGHKALMTVMLEHGLNVFQHLMVGALEGYTGSFCFKYHQDLLGRIGARPYKFVDNEVWEQLPNFRPLYESQAVSEKEKEQCYSLLPCAM